MNLQWWEVAADFAVEDLFHLLQTRFIALGEMPSQRQQWVFQVGFSKMQLRTTFSWPCNSEAGSLCSNIWMPLIFTEIFRQYFQPHVLADLPGPLQRTVDRGSNRSWRSKRWCLLHRQEVHLLWRVYPETAFGFNQTLCCCCCWFASWQAWSSQCVSRRERRLVEVGNSSAKLLRAFICPSCTILTETCWRFFPSHIHSMPTAVANCCWWQGFSGASAESAQMHS